MYDYEENDKAWEDRVNTQYGKFTRHPFLYILKWVAIILVGFIILGAAGKTIGFFGGWANEAVKVVSPANVTEQYDVLYTKYEALQAAACNAKNAENVAQTDNLLVESPEFAYAAQYRQISVDYNARYANIFKAKLVGPKDLPPRAPTLLEMQNQVC